jgi:uncharacterized membrane protein SirB2
MAYVLLKQLHLTTIVVTLTLFILRGAWMMASSPRLQARWVRIVPHLNDTLLLASGIGLAVLLQQYPLVHGWLTAKFFALILYIVLGTFALKRGKTRGQRITAWFAALLVFGYMAAVAVTHDPFPFAGLRQSDRNLSPCRNFPSEHPSMRYTCCSNTWGPTWLRRGSQSSVGHTEGQSTS